MKIAYYPGCALHGSSNDYERSVRACLSALGVGLTELDDWICCGATAAHSLNHKLATALPARNLAIAERGGFDDLLAPCPMCSAQLIKANQAIRQNPALQKEMSEIVEIELRGTSRVVNLIEIFQKIGPERIQTAAAVSLSEFKPACYYGCLLTRPAESQNFDDCEQPTSMESLLAALGAEPVEWNYRTECCGGGMTMANEETVLDLSQKILSNAASHGANCLVVACPMCHVNLDMKQADIGRRHDTRHDMMIYYLSDLVGLALGLDETALGIDKHFVRGVGRGARGAKTCSD
jgi:heterodisulfide reductase subunit B2